VALAVVIGAGLHMLCNVIGAGLQLLCLVTAVMVHDAVDISDAMVGKVRGVVIGADAFKVLSLTMRGLDPITIRCVVCNVIDST